ncbi:hypothetical protein CFHF_19625 [Caulobacter flavus]|uniref:Microcin J25-processing protein McjB C-terminal domain-containing protein n=1 Tax=Caulobacter flavus TaxID=1679497 RepID=A0A2N5CNY8_9CAUL|nr:lasso peptide biosynthesis B2 protein [Caulobacter flavus]AYV48615.1 hypothetical protein C1707_21440 [Caulobacter flavus]PLR08669.1 hypothetical protein CFHF_19625 [Caulobacter flavus]
MQAWLAPHVRAARVGGEIVLLDIEADAYFCLLDAAAHLTLQSDGGVLADPSAAADDLIEAGLLTLMGGASIAPVRARAVHGGLDPDDQATPGLSASAIAAALSANLTAARAIDRLSFADILALVGTVEPAAFAPASPDLLKESRRFAAMSPWLPRAGLCLMRSLQQRLYLARRGHATAWVFGVRTWPFQAHCWLQAGEVVLDDTPGRVGAFTPILVV